MLVTTKGIPLSDDQVLPESGFFTQQASSAASPVPLPSPAAVREEGVRQNGAVAAKRLARPPPVRFPSLGLLVKYGSLVSVAEAQCLFIVRKYLPAIPVPEVYGWQHDGQQLFIYMELVQGDTLEDAWDSLSEDDRVAVCGQLRDYVAAWRRLPQELFADTPFIGNVAGQELLDWVFVGSGAVGAGPFASVSQFHDWYTTAYGPHCLGPWEGMSPHPYRGHLPDNVPVVFAHADLHPINIMLAPRDADAHANHSPPRIAAFIDWQQAGWYPAYWEYCKSRWVWSAKVGTAWPERYLPLILDVDESDKECYNFWDYFVIARGM